MKIAILGTKGIPATWGGIERHVEELAVRYVQMGHDVTVYCRPYYTTTKDEYYKGIRLKVLPTLKGKNLDAISHTFVATMHLLSQKYDVIHYHAIGPSTLAFIPRMVGKKTVATIHGLDWQREKWGRRARTYLKFAERASVYFPNSTIAVSRFLKQYMEEKYNKPVNYIPSAVCDPIFIEPSAIKEYGLVGNDYILFVARLVPEKGCHYLIDAFKQIKTSKKLVIAGGSSHSDEYVKQLQDMADDRVIFTGYVYGDELHELYTNAYCYVQPSTIEGMPITLLEAVAYGKCVIASDIPPNIEVIKDTGLVFESKNVEGLRDALIQALDDQSLVTKLGSLAQAMGVAEYSYDSIAAKTAKLYAEIAAGRSGIIIDDQVNQSTFATELADDESARVRMGE